MTPEAASRDRREPNNEPGGAWDYGREIKRLSPRLPASQPSPSAVPEWCAIHQSYKWCQHNGGIAGDTGYEAPTLPPSAPKDIEGLRAALDTALDALECDPGHDGYVNHDLDVAWAAFRAALASSPVAPTKAPEPLDGQAWAEKHHQWHGGGDCGCTFAETVLPTTSTRLTASQPSPSAAEPERPNLANDIRRVDGNHDLGAGELADQLTALGWTKLPPSAPHPKPERVALADIPVDEPSAPEDIEGLRKIATAAREVARTDAMSQPKRTAALQALRAALASSPVAPTEGLRTAIEAIDYIAGRVQADSTAPGGQSWPGEIDTFLDDARALASSPVAPTEGAFEAQTTARARAGSYEAFLRLDDRQRRAFIEALATPGIAALPALDVDRLARALTTWFGPMYGDHEDATDDATGIAAEYARLATTTEETTDG